MAKEQDKPQNSDAPALPLKKRRTGDEPGMGGDRRRPDVLMDGKKPAAARMLILLQHLLEADDFELAQFDSKYQRVVESLSNALRTLHVSSNPERETIQRYRDRLFGFVPNTSHARPESVSFLKNLPIDDATRYHIHLFAAREADRGPTMLRSISIDMEGRAGRVFHSVYLELNRQAGDAEGVTFSFSFGGRDAMDEQKIISRRYTLADGILTPMPSEPLEQ